MNLKNLFGSHSKTYPDPFIKRLRSLVIGEGMLTEHNIFLMDHAIRNMPESGSVIEIGSYGGLSANVILHFLRKHNRPHRFFNCDPWIYEGYNDHTGVTEKGIDGREDVARTAYSAYMKQAYENAIRFLSPDRLPHTFQLTSDVFFEKWNANETLPDLFGYEAKTGGAISFAYIDGKHNYEQALRDFENVAKNILNGGFILLDDSANHLRFGSAEMMSVISKDARFKITDKTENYLLQRV